MKKMDRYELVTLDTNKLFKFKNFATLISFLNHRVPFWRIDRILGFKKNIIYRGQMVRLKTRVSVTF